MTKIIVDSNIIFSAMLNLDSRIAQILINGGDLYDFYAPKYVRTEIWEHQDKLKKIAKLDDEEFIEVYELVLKNITILDHSIIPIEKYQKAAEICKTIDVEDTIFVAFSYFLKCKLWTGDKKLINGLIKKEKEMTISTTDFYKDFLQKNKHKKS